MSKGIMELINQTDVDAERTLIQDRGHLALLSNCIGYKQSLMSPEVYRGEITTLTDQLAHAKSDEEQAKLLVVLVELDVKDTERIGEPLIQTLTHDLQTKAKGSFEFIAGDRNLATAILQLLENDPSEIKDLLTELCSSQSEAGIATPFDYRRLTIPFQGDFATARVADWIAFFKNTDRDTIKNKVEIGRSFSSTRKQRYTQEIEAWLQSRLSNRVQRLLDIGGSIGINARHLMDLLSISSATVTDYRTEDELKECFYGEFKPIDGVKYILGTQGDITQVSPDDQTYDLITLNNVLVHIKQKEIALRNVLPRLSSNGHLIISGGYNANPPRRGFWLFNKTEDGLVLLERGNEH